jgi:hypothetical protein
MLYNESKHNILDLVGKADKREEIGTNKGMTTLQCAHN